MVFELQTKPTRIIDHDRGLELVRVGGAYDEYTEAFYRFPRDNSSKPLTCWFGWREIGRAATDQEKKSLPESIDVIVTREVVAIHGEGPVAVAGLSVSETMNCLLEALLCGAKGKFGHWGEKGQYQFVGNTAVTAELSAAVLNNMQLGEV